METFKLSLQRSLGLFRKGFGFRPKTAIGLALVLGTLALLACTPENAQSTFDAKGPVAQKQADLFYLIFWAAVAVFVVVVGALLYAMVRYRSRPGQTEMPKQTHGHTGLEITWTIFPVIVLAIIAVPTVIVLFDISEKPAPEENALEVNVIGHQWWFEFEYPEQGVVTANQLHIPVDRKVQFNLLSGDVIHSFWIPKLGGKVDVVPNNDNGLWLQADSSTFDEPFPQTLYGQCAEFCGVAHAHMKFRVIVDTQEGFDAWVEQYHALADGPEQSSELADKGKALFADKGCLLCHDIAGAGVEAVRQARQTSFESGAAQFPGPNLTNLGTREILAAGALNLNRENLLRWLTDPTEVKPGNRMGQLADVYNNPDLEMQPNEILALAEYLLNQR